MKKIKYYVLFALMIIIIPVKVAAYGIENFYINATVEKNGDLLVEEYFYLSGDYNGFERIIKYANSDAYDFNANLNSYGGSKLHNGTGIIIEEVRGIDIYDTFSFDNIDGEIFKKVSRADKGDFGVYIENYEVNGKAIKIFNPSHYNKAFYIKYTLKNMAILHNDIGELGWNIFGNELSEYITYLKVIINLPSNKNVRVWAHGPLKGESKILSSDKLEVTISGLNAYTAIDARCTFDREVISDSTKKSNVEALNKILKYEESKAEQANYERKQKDNENILDAERILSSCENNPSRSCYNYVYEKVAHILDETKRNEFTKRLESLNIIINKKEEDEAKSALKYVEMYPTYNNYKSAQSKIAILRNKDVKSLLEARLENAEILVKKKEQRIDNCFIGGIVFIILGMILITYKTYKKTGKDEPSEFNQHYLRDFPDDFSPATVEYLMNGVITNKSVSAEILNMIYKKIIIVEQDSDKKNDFVFKLNVNENITLTTKEKYLKKLLFADRDTLTLKEFKKRSEKNYSSFLSAWDSVITSSYIEAENKKLYYFPEKKEKKKIPKKIIIPIILILLLLVNLLNFSYIFFIGNFIAMISFFFVVMLIIIKASHSTTTEYIVSKKPNKFKKRAELYLLLFFVGVLILFLLSIFVLHYYHNSLIFVGIALLIFIITFIIVKKMKKRSAYGATEYKKWVAMKNFMTDFGSFEDKDLPEITLWEKYLVYATVLGCAKKLQKTMKIKIENTGLVSDDALRNVVFINTINNSLHRTIVSSHSKAISAKNAHDYRSSSGGSSGSWSSGSGGGGGFSSGGGSFGGGGGGGRF